LIDFHCGKFVFDLKATPIIFESLNCLTIRLWSLAFARSAFIRFVQRPMPFAFLPLSNQSGPHLSKVDNQILHFADRVPVSSGGKGFAPTHQE
jgi:hypothetical protein